LRNYITAFYTYLFAYDNPYPNNLQEGWFVGLTQDSAHGLAAAELPVFAGFDVSGLTDLGIRYILLNRETLIGAFQEFRLSSGQSPDCHFHTFDRLATVEELEPGESPFRAGDFPSSDGKRTSGTKVVATETLLQGLQNLAGLLIRAGFTNNGPRSLLGQLAPFIIALVMKQPIPTRPDLFVLIREIEQALLNPHGS
jgi:hypothetical protein